jgi:hypothetical protein
VARSELKSVGERLDIMKRLIMNRWALKLAVWLCNVPRRIGQRGVLLLVFAFTVFGYGIGLMSGYTPTFTSALGISDPVFGMMFIADGIVLTLGAWYRWGRLPYAIAATVSFFWAFILTGFWAAPFGWTASMSWLGMGLVQLCAVIWPEPANGEQVLSRAMRAYEHTISIVTHETERIDFFDPELDLENKDGTPDEESPV